MNERSMGADVPVLRSQRDATRYRILVEIAERQPAVSQREVAESLGITAQAVSDYLGELADAGHVIKHGRGRYEVTKEGVDWLLSTTGSLREFVDHVSEDVLGEVETVTALADATIEHGQRVTLSMEDGVLHATPGETGSHTAVAVTDGAAGEDVGVTDFEGVLEFDLGSVTVLAVPGVRDGGSRVVEPGTLSTHAEDADLVAVVGTEALVASRRADIEPDLRFGTREAVPEAAMKGQDVLLVAVTTEVAAHTGALREHSIGYEVIEPSPES